MKIQIITGRYPSEQEPYNHMFVHTRNTQYLKNGEDVEVYVPSKQTGSYAIDGIQVYLMPVKDIVKKLEVDSVVMVHLLLHSVINELDGGIIYDFLITNDKPTLFFIHGIETQSIWRSRREDIQLSKPKSIARFIYRDFYLINKMAKTFTRVMSETKNIRFVTVSNWMRKDAEETLGVLIESKTEIIANGIDTTLFSFQDRWKDRNKLLTIRPLSFKGKYAIDLAVDTMKYLLNKDVNLSIYGKGEDEHKIIDYINHQNLNNKITLYNDFIPHAKLPDIHSQYGIYYAVTRMDAQGVSMCEAMASGLPTVSFDTCAIPEFIQDGDNGFLIHNFDLKEASNKIEALINDKNLFLQIAEEGRKSIEKIDITITTQKEINIAKKITS